MKNIAITILILFRITGYAQEIMIGEYTEGKLSIHKTPHKYELVNAQGKPVISDLDSAWFFENSDLFLIRRNGLWGMTSLYGKEIIPVRYNKIEHKYNWFWEVTQNNKKGIYNTYKGLILPVEFDAIYFSGKMGMEFIVTREKKYGVFSDNGKEVIPVQYDEIINKGRALVLKEGEECTFFIGDRIISDSIVLDKSFDGYGKEIPYTKTFYVFIKNGKYGIMDGNGKILIQPKYQDILNRMVACNGKNESYVLVKDKNQWGMIDLNENELIPLLYRQIELITPDVAVVKLNGYKYFYNLTSKKLLDDFNFDSFSMFSEAYSRVTKGGKESLVDNKKGFKLVLPFMYDNVLMYNKWIVVMQNFKYGVVDISNKILIPLEYDEISISCNKVIAKKGDKYGLVDMDNKVLLPFEYSFILGYSDNIVVQKAGSKTKTLDCNLKCIENCN